MKKTVVGTLVSTALVVLSVSPQTIQIPDSPESSYNWDQFKSSNGLRFTGDAAQTIEADVITVKDRLKRIITSIYGEGFTGYNFESYPNDENQYVSIFDDALSFEANEEKFEALKKEIRSARVPFTALIGG